MNILVTGASGFVGQHMIDLLLKEKHKVYATGLPHDANNTAADFFNVDLTEAEAVTQLPLDKVEAIIHLAGLAAVGPSFEEPAKYVNVNSTIQINLFERCKTLDVRPTFLIISSGTIYKGPSGTKDLPLTEGSPVLPTSPYAVSKLSQEALALYYSHVGFPSIIARPFNHIGPGQAPGFIASDLAKQIVEAQQSGQNTLRVGNLDTKRDYTDVRDIVRAYHLLITGPKPGEIFNICSGSSLSGHDLLTGLMGTDATKLEIKKDPSLYRPAETPEIYGSYQKLEKATGWKPIYKTEQTLADIMAYWRNKLAPAK